MDQHVWFIASQKGGVCKSTISYGLSHLLSEAGRKVILLDTDHPQHSAARLGELRGEKLKFPIVKCRWLHEVGNHAEGFDYVVIDGAPHASSDTLAIAEASSMVVLASNPNLLDLIPTIELARELEAAGIPRERIVFIITRSGSKRETISAQLTVEQDGWAVMANDLHFAVGYGTACDKGLSVAEANHPSTRFKARALLEEIVTEGEKRQ